jgi:uncharacterized membrane protein
MSSAAVPDPGLLTVVATTAAALGLIAWAALRAERGRLADDGEAHRFWGCATLVAVLWHFDTGPVVGIHLLGATLACALLGLRLGLLALAAGSVIQHAGDGAAWSGWGGAFLLGAALPAALACLALRVARRAAASLGPLPLVVAAFVGGGASMAAAVAVQGWVGLADVGRVTLGAPELAGLALMMGIAEANLSVAALATIAAQRPQWLERVRPRR